MKNILKLLSTIAAISIVLPTLTLSKISNQTKTLINSTPEIPKVATVILNFDGSNNENHSLDFTKIDESLKGNFHRLSGKYLLLLDVNSHSHFLDLTKIDESLKGATTEFIRLKILELIGK